MAVADAARHGVVDPDAPAALERSIAAVEAVGLLLPDAVAVLDGDGRARQRLRHLLAWEHGPPDGRVERDPPPRRLSRAPLIDPHGLALLVAGIMRAAGDRHEADAMLRTLGDALEPALIIEGVTELAGAGAQMIPLLGTAPPGFGPGGGPPGPLGPPGPFGPGGGLPHWPGRPPGGRRPRPPEGEPVWDTAPTFTLPIAYLDPGTCAHLAAIAIAEIQRTATDYAINAIAVVPVRSQRGRPYPCPGRQIRITGRGFGTSGKVLFPTTDGPQTYGAANADLWSPSEIVVTVPPWATSGELRIQTVERTVEVCGNEVVVLRLGSSHVLFDGGAPAVFSLTVNGGAPPACVPPDTVVTVAWETSPGQGTSVNVTISTPGVDDVSTTVPAGPGSLVYRTPLVGSARVVHIHVVADNGCEGASPATRDGDVTVAVPTTLRVEGLEVTQGVQRFQDGPPPFEWVATVAGKDTIVRAYVAADRSGFNSNMLPNVSGRLLVDGQPLMPLNTPPQITARSAGLSSRRNLDDSLNFRIPAGWSHGTKRLELTVWGTDECGIHYAEFERFWTWQDKVPLPVRWVRIRDRRDGTQTPGAIPTDQDVRPLVLRALDLLPTPATDIGPAWVAEWDAFTDWRDQSKGGGQHALLHALDGQHNCEQWESLYPCATPDAAIWVGIYADPGGGGMAIRSGDTAVAGEDRIVIAHELGHTIGRMHVLQGCGTTVPDGPYDPLTLDGGLVWDVAIDPASASLVGRPTRDLMSYGCNRWTSADQWNWFLGVL